MKKLLALLSCVLLLTACSNKKDEIKTENNPEVEQQPSTEKEDLVGGWSINQELCPINDAYFEIATKELLGVEYQPLLVLGTQPVAGENIAYLSYATTVTPDAKQKLKIVVVNHDVTSDEIKVSDVIDFNLLDYLDVEGSTTPEGLMGGWQDNTQNLPNMLEDNEKEIFDKAFEGFTGVGYTPVIKLGSQVVAGTNYAFLAVGRTIAENEVSHLYVVKIYADLQGNAKVTNICGLNLSELSIRK